MTNTYIAGGSVRVTGSFKNIAKTAVDPTTVVMKYRKPDGTIVTLTYGVDNALVKASTGNYYADIITDQGGRWMYQFHGTGAVVAAAENQFNVTPLSF